MISIFLGARQDPSPRQSFCNYLHSEIESLEERDFFLILGIKYFQVFILKFFFILLCKLFILGIKPGQVAVGCQLCKFRTWVFICK